MKNFVFQKFLMLLVVLSCSGSTSIANNHVISKSEIQVADSVIWKESYGRISAHLYRDDLDTTRYGGGPISLELEKARDAYESSSYLKNDGMLVKEAFLKSLRVLSDDQVRALLGDSRGGAVMRIFLYLHKGKVVKTRYRFFEDLKIGDIPDGFIVIADRNVRSIHFRGFEEYGIQYYFCSMFISYKDIQDYTGVKSDLQTYIESQNVLWVLDGDVMRDTKGLTMDMIDCSEPYVPLGKALGKEPGEFESLSVITGKKAAERYGTKETAQVVEIKTKSKSKNAVTVDELAYNVVTASGNGFSKENALKVIYVSDEYAIFRDMMGLKRLKQDYVEKGYDRMTLDRGNKGETITLWFDANLSYDKYHHK